jgi:hypothetical protein
MRGDYPPVIQDNYLPFLKIKIAGGFQPISRHLTAAVRGKTRIRNNFLHVFTPQGGTEKRGKKLFLRYVTPQRGSQNCPVYRG